MSMKTKIGISQWHKPTPKRVKDIVEVISYTLAGTAGFSFMTSHPEWSTVLLFVAGAIDKFAPRFFGEE
jgi:hypothetical protein